MTNPGPAITTGNNSQAIYAAVASPRVLAKYIGVNANATGDTVLPIINSSSFSVSAVICTNASISLTTAAAGLFTAPGAGGTAIVANAALSAMTGSTVVSARTVASTAASTVDYLYLNVATAQGAAATFDIYVIGYDFSPS